MNLLPLLVINGILLVITILLAIAERFLVNYGECKITINDKKNFTVKGGEYLLQVDLELVQEISCPSLHTSLKVIYN